MFDLWRHEEDSPTKLLKFLQQPDATFIGFNNKSFDDIVVAAWCMGRNEMEIKYIANDIIVNRVAPWNAFRKYALREVGFDSIDLIEVAP